MCNNCSEEEITITTISVTVIFNKDFPQMARGTGNAVFRHSLFQTACYTPSEGSFGSRSRKYQNTSASAT